MEPRTLIELARQAMKMAYAPYSHFQVGAALVTDDGRVFTGCNVENASYGAAICAERTAAVKAVSEGAHRFTMLAVVSSSGRATPPCGICRQFLSEFSSDLQVWMEDRGTLLCRSLAELMPMSELPLEETAD